MVTNLVNDSYVFSSDMQDIRIADVHDKLSLRIEVDGQEALSEIYYPDHSNTVIIATPETLSMSILYVLISTVGMTVWPCRPWRYGWNSRTANPPKTIPCMYFTQGIMCLLTRRRTLSSTPDIKSSISGRTALTISPFSSRPGQRYL